MLQRRAIDDSSQNSHQHSHQHSHQRRCVARIVTLFPLFNDSCSHECIFLALCRIEMPIVADSLCKVEVSLKQAHQLHANESTDRFTDRQNDEKIDHCIDDVIEADSLIDLLIEEIDFELAIVAGSLVARERMIRFTGEQSDESEQVIALRIDVIEAGSLLIQTYYIVELVSFVDRLNQEINRCLPLQQAHFECRSSRLTIE